MSLEEEDYIHGFGLATTNPLKKQPMGKSQFQIVWWATTNQLKSKLMKKKSVSESGVGNDKPIEITTNGKKSISESVNKKRPRIKTNAKSMIQVRQNYMIRT